MCDCSEAKIREVVEKVLAEREVKQAAEASEGILELFKLIIPRQPTDAKEEL